MSNAMFKIFSAVLSLTIASGGFLFAAQNDGRGTKQGSNQHKAVNPHTRAAGNNKNESQVRGQLAFAEHCSRCHNAPQGFSPEISGTISRHMQVRANLSAEEERALLRFLNP